MRTTRRDFLKYCFNSAAALGLSYSVLGRLEKALAGGPNSPVVIWLSAASCTGCTVSLANLISTSGPADIADLLINDINLVYQPNLMGAAGDLAVQTLRDKASGPYILAVEGGIPTAFGGHSCTLWTENGQEVTAQQAVTSLAPGAAAILAIGTCASFGGVCGSAPNVTGIKTVSAVTGRPTINIAGCPTHPDWIVSVVAQLIAGTSPQLDSSGRPTQFFGRTVHDRCPRRETDEINTYGVNGRCLKALHCRGPVTSADCPPAKVE